MISAILNALAAIPVIAKYVDKAVQAIVIWYLKKQTSGTLAAIADTAASAARANSDEERYQAAEKWQQTISRPRVSAD